MLVKHLLAALAFTAAILGGTVSAHAQSETDVVVNRQRISDEAVYLLEDYYDVTIDDGDYWYDRFSGLWGQEGGPASGQIAPGLDLGGALRGDASGGTSGVFFNGRQLHATEMQYLRQLFGSVPQGRYWLAPNGVGGVEGGPASFSLAPKSSGGSASAGGGSDGYYSGYIDRGYGGTYGSDGSCYYISVEGGDVLGPGC